VLLSLVEALTLTPMRCAQFVESGRRSTRLGRAFDTLFGAMREGYARSLAAALSHRGWVLAASAAFFLVGILPIRLLNKEFLPAEDQSRFLLRLKTPVGSSLAYTDAKFREVETFLAARPEVSRYFVAVGGFGGGEVNTGICFITLKAPASRGPTPEGLRRPSQADVMEIFRRKLNAIADVKVTVQDLSMRGFTASRGFPVEFSITGGDWEALAAASERIQAEMGTTGLVSDIDSDYLAGMPEVQIFPNREKAARRGVSILALSTTVQALLSGALAGRYPKEGHRIDIRVKLEEDGKDPRTKLPLLAVRNNRGELIPLSELVRVEERPTPSSECCCSWASPRKIRSCSSSTPTNRSRTPLRGPPPIA